MSDWFYYVYFGSIAAALIAGFVAFVFSPLDNDDTDWHEGDFWQNFIDTIRYSFGEDVK